MSTGTLLDKTVVFSYTRLGATIYMLARSEGKGRWAREGVIRRTANENVHLENADLSNPASVRDSAASFLGREPCLGCGRQSRAFAGSPRGDCAGPSRGLTR